EVTALICRNVVGFDLNPLAVIASRVNYLFALGTLLRYRPRQVGFEIPVFLTDSVLLPVSQEVQGNLFGGESVAFPMTVGTFHLPTVIVERRLVAELTRILHHAVTERHTRQAFITAVFRELEIPRAPETETTLGALFDAMAALERQRRNGVWA